MRRILVFAGTLLLLIAPAAVVSAAPPTLGGCQILPDDNPWNTDISGAAVHPNSANYIKNINANGGKFVHPDFGEDPTYGIPWTTATAATPPLQINFDVDDESDPGPYPIPDGAPVEGGDDADGDRHVLVVETTNCVLYELYDAWPQETGGVVTSWDAYSGAVFDLGSNALRPEGWTSADAAGLPILPGLAKCDEADSGTIDHALRFTVNRTQGRFVYPATHEASDLTGANYPPMGLRFRLKANYNLSGFTGQALAIAKALKQYGMILADNGSNWFISGETNPGCWDDENLELLKSIPGKAFEAIVSPAPPDETAGDLTQNGSFEAGTPNGKLPTFWKVSAHQDRRQCDRDGLVFAHSGRCAFEFKGTAAAPADSFMQNVSVPPLPPGGSLNIQFFAATQAAPTGAGLLRITKFYGNGTKTNASLPIPDGTNAYAPLTYSISGTAISNLTRVRLKFIYRGRSGKMLIDTISVTAAS